MTTITSTTSLTSPALLMEDSNATDSVTQVIVHPLVLLHVLDHHTRRQEASGRVIGTLLGRRDGKTVRKMREEVCVCVDVCVCVCVCAGVYK
jgi:hypothetical protein